jgi:hypothetical protein
MTICVGAMVLIIDKMLREVKIREVKYKRS